MPTITVLSRQSPADIAIQECGSIEALFALADRNGIAITDDLTPGSTLTYHAADVARKPVVTRLAGYGARPATAISARDSAICPYEGIGIMAIERDFVVEGNPR